MANRMTISIDRNELLRLLNERLAEAKIDDARVTAKHRADEEAALEKFRAGLRDALKWNYAKAKQFFRRRDLQLDTPACPELSAPKIENAIRMIKWDAGRDTYRIAEGDTIHSALSWLPKSKRSRRTPCDNDD